MLVQRNPAVFFRAVNYVDAGSQMKREVEEDCEWDHLFHVPDYPSLERKHLDQSQGIVCGGTKNLGYLSDPKEAKVAKHSHVAELHDFLVILTRMRERSNKVGVNWKEVENEHSAQIVNCNEFETLFKLVNESCSIFIVVLLSFALLTEPKHPQKAEYPALMVLGCRVRLEEDENDF